LVKLREENLLKLREEFFSIFKGKRIVLIFVIRECRFNIIFIVVE
jgi:hypothetical protein